MTVARLDPVLHICALAIGDLTLLGSAQVNHLLRCARPAAESLDHAMWFMRPFPRRRVVAVRPVVAVGSSGDRALTRGEIFTRSRRWSAAVMQEAKPAGAGADRWAVSGL